MLFKQNSLQFPKVEKFVTFKNDVQMFLHISDYIHISSKSAPSLSTQSASGMIHNLWNIKSIGTEDYVQEQYKALWVCSRLPRLPVASVDKSFKYAPLHFISTASDLCLAQQE